jgi:hypothetical protein
VTPKTTPQPPGDAELQQQLGGAWHAYRALLDAAADLRPEWKYYGQKYGWTLKLFAGSRNLCFLGPHEGELMVAFLFGPRDFERVLESGVPQAMKDELLASKRYVEGTPLRIRVRTPADLPPIMELLEIKRHPVRPARPRTTKSRKTAD